MGAVSDTRILEFEMFPIVHDNRSDLEELVAQNQESIGSLLGASLGKNQSVNSFISADNELTITRWINSRKFSMMSFKPSDNNVIDIVVKKGETTDGKETLLMKEIGSQDIRSRYSVKAKAAVITIGLLLAIMVCVITFALITQPWKIDPDRENGAFVMKSQGVELSGNATTTYPTSGNFTYS